MNEAPPLLFTWNGDGFTPATAYWGRQADKHFVIGENYELVEHHGRSHKSHAHFFAVIHDAWQNLPEEMAERFPTEEHLRKYALIKAGYADTNTLVCSSKAEALRVAAFMRPTDEFAVITVKDSTVTRYVAQSQSTRAMGAKVFQESKDATLGILSQMVGTSRKALEGNKSA